MLTFYSTDNVFLSKGRFVPYKFTGILEHPDGVKEWLFEGKWHRINGPAIESPDGIKAWFIYNKQVTELECKLLHNVMRLKGLL